MDSIRARLRAEIELLTGRELSVDDESDFATDSPISDAAWAGVPEASVAEAIARTIGVRFAKDLSNHPASKEFVEKVSHRYAIQHKILGLEGADGNMRLAVGGLESWPQVDLLSRFFGRPMETIVAASDDLLAAINAAYAKLGGQAQSVLQTLQEEEESSDGGVSWQSEGAHGSSPRKPLALGKREDLLDFTGRAPVVQLVNYVLSEAVNQRASDIHVQPYEHRLLVRMRVDGLLYDALEVPKTRQEEVISRIKVIGRMNIAEKRLPQDGRETVQVGGRLVDLRIASMPTSFGERVVIRLLDKSAHLYSLGELGMDDLTLERFRSVVRVEHGLLLVTGPTGSGKSTTLYAVLQEIDARVRNVLTLEDPIEYQLEGISQTQISDKKGMTFASGLRSVLRQDPDIIMVGEIRDHETAVMAIQSALTGHLVFSTLHTNDAASAVTRLLDLGVEPYLVSSSVIGVLAQRLVRTVCPECGQPIDQPAELLSRVELSPHDVDSSKMRQGAGCATCRTTGYVGRLGIFELLVIDEAIRQQIQARAIASEIKDVAKRAGMRTLRQDGIAKVLAGRTTVDEVVRVTV